MKILKTRFKTLGILVTIMTFMSLLVGDASYPDTGNEARARLEKGSSLMKPGYLQLDEWKGEGVNTHAVTRKNDVEASLENQVAPRNEVRPELKKKVSSDQQKVQIKEGVFEEPANIPKPILDFLNTREGTVVEYRAVFSGEKYKVFWIERYAEETSWGGEVFAYYVKVQTFTSNGEKTGNELVIQKESGAGISDVVALSDGKFAFIWSGNVSADPFYAAPEDYFLRMQIFDREGEKIGNEALLTTKIASLDTATTLSDGNLVVVWRERSNPWLNEDFSLKMQIFDQNGVRAGNEYILTDGRTLLREVEVQDITAMADGSFAITWREKDADENDSLRMQVFGSDGVRKGNEHFLTDGKTLYKVNTTRIESFSNGEIISLFWIENRVEGYPGSRSLWMQLVDQNGEIVGVKQQISGGRTLINVGVTDLVAISDNELKVSWYESDTNWNMSYRTQVFNLNSGEKAGAETIVAEDQDQRQMLSMLTTMPDGRTLNIWWEQHKNGTYSLKSQIYGLDGNGEGEKVILENKPFVAALYQFRFLPEGNIAVIWQERSNGKYSLWMQLFKADGTKVGSETCLTGGRNLGMILESFSFLQNGNFVLTWSERDAQNNWSVHTQAFNQEGAKIGSEYLLTAGRALGKSYQESVTLLPNGNYAIAWQEYDNNCNLSYRVQIFNQAGEKVGEERFMTEGHIVTYISMKDVILSQNGNVTYIWYEEGAEAKKHLRLYTIDQNGVKLGESSIAEGNFTDGDVKITKLPDGKVEVNWTEWTETDQGSWIQQYKMKQFADDGQERQWTPTQAIQQAPPTVTEPHFVQPKDKERLQRISSPAREPLKKDLVKTLRPNLGPGILAPDEGLQTDLAINKLRTDLAGDALTRRNLEDMLDKALRERGGLEIYQELKLSSRDIDSILVRIVNEPTEEEKKILDAAEKLKEDLEETGVEPGLTKASDDFIRVVANVLLAQALPDLLTEQGMRDIRTLFDEFNKEKTDIIEAYRESVNLYYNDIKDELIKNRAILEIKDILSPDMKDKDIRDLGREAVDNIIERIRKDDTKTEKEKALLKKEAELRNQYLNPALKRLEENMRFLLESYTHRLTLVLDGAGVTNKEKLE